MNVVIPGVLSTDRLFQDSPDAGHSDCLCSRCLKPIGEETIPIRAWPDTGGELRYHPACLGFTTLPAPPDNGCLH